MINRRRVVETYDPRRNVRGSGFLLSARLVVTAAHCVPSGLNAIVHVRTEAQAEFVQEATVRWTGDADLDLALLDLGDGDPYRLNGQDPLPLGRPVSTVTWQAVGYPWAQERPNLGRPRTAAESAEGRLDPITGMRSGSYDLDVTTGVPDPRGAGRSPWGGMSGAAVFAEDILVAVLTIDPARFGPDRLRAIPIHRLADDPSAARLIGEIDRPFVEFVWPGHRLVLAWPYERSQTRSAVLLLQYQHATIPFDPIREPDLEGLRSWCETSGGTAMATLEGVGGIGKTRMAAELCGLMHEQGWIAGFLKPHVNDEHLRTLARLPEPRLVVVDAAESREDDQLQLAWALAAVPQQAPVRILALARSSNASPQDAEWLRHLQTPKNPLQAAFLDAKRVKLLPLPATSAGIAARDQIFRTARDHFASLLGLQVTPVQPDLAEPRFDTFLFLHIAALVALTAPAQLGLNERDLLEAVLAAERDLIWRPTARAHGVGSADAPPTDAELDVALAVATLAIADSRSSATALLQAVPDTDTMGSTGRTVDWLESLYPGTGWLRPIRPDRLGEHHVASVIQRHPDLPRLLLQEASRRLTDARSEQDVDEPARAAEQTLTVLARAAKQAQGGVIGTALEALLGEPDAGGAPLLSRLVGVIECHEDVSTLRPLVRGLTAALGVVKVPAAAEIARAELTQRTHLLDDLVYYLDSQAIDYARSTAQSDPSQRSYLVDALAGASLFAVRWGPEGEADAAVREALDLARILYEEEPFGLAFLRSNEERQTNASLLATVLQLASMLFTDSRPEDAIHYAMEASDLWRRIDDHEGSHYSLAEHSFDHLAFALWNSGRQNEAILAFRREIDRLERLAEIESDDDERLETSVRTNGAIMTLACHLAKAGFGRDAVETAHDAVHRAQALDASEGPIVRFGLGAAYNGLVEVFREVGRPLDALEAAEAAVSTLRLLDAEQPGLFEPSIRSALQALATLLVNAGRPEHAIEPAREAVNIQRSLIEASPVTNREMLGAVLLDLSHALAAAGHFDEARYIATEGIEACDELVRERFGNQSRVIHTRDALLEQLSRS